MTQRRRSNGKVLNQREGRAIEHGPAFFVMMDELGMNRDVLETEQLSQRVHRFRFVAHFNR